MKDAKTGKKLVDKKFYKADFNEILESPEYGQYCDILLKKAMIKTMSGTEHAHVDLESYEEVRSVAIDISKDIIDPEE